MVSAKDTERLTNDVNNGVEGAKENIDNLMKKWGLETEKFINSSVIFGIRCAARNGNYKCICDVPFYPRDNWDYKDDTCWGYRWNYDESKFEKTGSFIRELRQLGYEIIPMYVSITGYKPHAFFELSWLSNEK